VPHKVFDGVLQLAERHINRLHNYSSTSSARPFAVRTGILHPDQNRVSYFAGAWRNAIGSYVTNNDCTIAELKLRPVILTYSDPLDEPECGDQPSHCRSNVWVNQYRNHGCAGY